MADNVATLTTTTEEKSIRLAKIKKLYNFPNYQGVDIADIQKFLEELKNKDFRPESIIPTPHQKPPRDLTIILSRSNIDKEKNEQYLFPTDLARLIDNIIEFLQKEQNFNSGLLDKTLEIKGSNTLLSLADNNGDGYKDSKIINLDTNEKNDWEKIQRVAKELLEAIIEFQESEGVKNKLPDIRFSQWENLADLWITVIRPLAEDFLQTQIGLNKVPITKTKYELITLEKYDLHQFPEFLNQFRSYVVQLLKSKNIQDTTEKSPNPYSNLISAIEQSSASIFPSDSKFHQKKTTDHNETITEFIRLFDWVFSLLPEIEELVRIAKENEIKAEVRENLGEAISGGSKSSPATQSEQENDGSEEDQKPDQEEEPPRSLKELLSQNATQFGIANNEILDKIIGQYAVLGVDFFRLPDEIQQQIRNEIRTEVISLLEQNLDPGVLKTASSLDSIRVAVSARFERLAIESFISLPNTTEKEKSVVLDKISKIKEYQDIHQQTQLNKAPNPKEIENLEKQLLALGLEQKDIINIRQTIDREIYLRHDPAMLSKISPQEFQALFGFPPNPDITLLIQQIFDKRRKGYEYVITLANPTAKPNLSPQQISVQQALQQSYQLQSQTNQQVAQNKKPVGYDVLILASNTTPVYNPRLLQKAVLAQQLMSIQESEIALQIIGIEQNRMYEFLGQEQNLQKDEAGNLPASLYENSPANYAQQAESSEIERQKKIADLAFSATAKFGGPWGMAANAAWKITPDFIKNGAIKAKDWVKKHKKEVMLGIGAGALITIANLLGWLKNLALKASLAVGGALSGAVVGFAMGGIPGAVIGFVGGGLFGWNLPAIWGSTKSFIGSIPGRVSGFVDKITGSSGSGSSGSLGSNLVAQSVGGGGVILAGTLFTSYSMLGAFLMPTVDQSGDISKYVTITKEADPGVKFDEARDITYTITIEADKGYSLQINQITDTLKITYNKELNPKDDEVIQPIKQASDFVDEETNLPLTTPLIINSGEKIQLREYIQQFNNTDHHDSNATNEFEISFNIIGADPGVEAPQNELTTIHKAKTGQTICFGECPSIQEGCWPTTGYLKQGPNSIPLHPDYGVEGIDGTHEDDQAIDISNNLGTTVYSTFDGKAYFYPRGTGFVCAGGDFCYGHHVVVESNGFELFYAHLNEIYLINEQTKEKELITGQTVVNVKAGDVIGETGFSGLESWGPNYGTAGNTHLHWELRPPSLDMRDYIPGGEIRLEFVRSCYDQ